MPLAIILIIWVAMSAVGFSDIFAPQNLDKAILGFVIYIPLVILIHYPLRNVDKDSRFLIRTLKTGIVEYGLTVAFSLFITNILSETIVDWNFIVKQLIKGSLFAVFYGITIERMNIKREKSISGQ